MKDILVLIGKAENVGNMVISSETFAMAIMMVLKLCNNAYKVSKVTLPT